MATAGTAAATGAALAPTVSLATPPAAGFTRIATTIHPTQTIDVDAAELESLTRQGLVVGVAPPPRPAAAPDELVAYVVPTINPAVLLAVDAAELESLTRQGLVAEVKPLPVAGLSGRASGVGTALPPTVTVSVFAGRATGTGTALSPGVGGYGVGGYGTQPYGV